MDAAIGVVAFVVALAGALVALRAVARVLARDWHDASKDERPWLVAVLLVVLFGF